MSATGKSKIRAYLGGKFLFVGLMAGQAVTASDFNAEKIMKEMSSDERSAYLAGIIEGLAIARYHKDAKNKDGMGCIYDWFYKDKGNLKVIMDAFDRYPSYPPGSIIDVLVKQKCGG